MSEWEDKLAKDERALLKDPLEDTPEWLLILLSRVVHYRSMAELYRPYWEEQHSLDNTHEWEDDAEQNLDIERISEDLKRIRQCEEAGGHQFTGYLQRFGGLYKQCGRCKSSLVLWTNTINRGE